jgi:methyltransferase (TIGR00027 family)
MKSVCHRRCGLLALYGIVMFALMSLIVSGSHAIEPGEVSIFAERQAGLRAVGAMDPDEKVRNPDYFAENFLPATFWLFGGLSKEYQKSKTFIQFYRIAGYYATNALTHHIDGILQQMAEHGLRQVVTIGAGFDSRPYRFGERMPKVRFFEVAPPAASDRKVASIKDLLGELPRSVTYIPVDCRAKPIFDALVEAGYDETQKTLFIWEGATPFTDPRIVDRILNDIARHSASGSEVVFDYVLGEVVNGDFSNYPGALFASVSLSAKGEPWTFGIPEGQTTSFINRYGLEVITDLGSEALANRYLVRSDGTMDGSPTAYLRVVHARVGH